MKKTLFTIAILATMFIHAETDTWTFPLIPFYNEFKAGDPATDASLSIVDGAIMTIADPSVIQKVEIETQPAVAQIPFLTAVAFNLVPGYSSVNKFGHNPTADAGDNIWAGDGAYAFYPTNGNTLAVYSSSTEDDTTGTGAHTVIYYGLDYPDRNEISEIVTLDGQTPVTLTKSYWRMYRGVVLTIGTSPSNVGNLIVTNGAGTVAAYIAATDGQTQQDAYTIPAGKEAQFIQGYTALKNDTFQGVTGSFKWQMRLNNGSVGAWQTKGEIGLINIGSSHWQYEYGIPAGMIPELTDIRIIQSAATDTLDSVCGYDLLMRDTD